MNEKGIPGLALVALLVAATAFATDFGSKEERDAQRRAKLQELAAMGRGVVVPLLRVLESYKSPDGAPNALSLKARVAETLGELGDDRAVYYLAQQVNIGEQEDEITNAALRRASAAALGALVGAEFSADDEGVAAARQWWQGSGRRVYDRLAF